MTNLAARDLSHSFRELFDILLPTAARMPRAHELRMFFETRRDGFRPVGIALDEFDDLIVFLSPPPFVELVHRVKYQRVPIVRLSRAVRSLLNHAILEVLDLQGARP